MPYDILQGVKYDPRYDDQNFALIAQGLDEANKRYDIAEASISDALAQYGAIPAVKEDRPFLAKRLDQFSQDINEMVNKKYAGDYGAASKEIARRIKQEHPYFAAAKQTEEAYRQALPLYQKLQAEGKLVTRGGVNPLAKSTFDEQGNIVGTPTYEMYERGPYEDWIAKNYSQAFQNEVAEKAPKFTGQSPYAIAQKVRGLSDETIAKRIGDTDAKKFLEDNKVFAIEYNLDPNKAEDLKVAKDYLVKTAQSQVATQIDNQYLSDKQWELNAEEAAYNRRKAAEKASQMLDIETMGPRAQDIVENTFLDQAGSLSKVLDIPGFPLAKNNIKDVKAKLLKSIETDRKAFEDKDSDPQIKARVIGPRLEAAKQNLKRIESVEPILEKNRQIYKQKYGTDPSDFELAKFIDTDSEALQREYTYTRPVLNPLTSQMLKTTVKEMSNAKFRIGDEDVVGTSLSDVAKRLDVTEPILRAVLEDENYKPRYNVVSGEYYINVPTDVNMTDAGKLVPGKKGSYKRLYFTPDELSAEYSIALKTIKNEISKGSDKPLQINPKGDVLSYVYNPSYGGEKANKRIPRIDVYDRRTGKPLVGEDGNPIVFSISDMENHIEELNSIQQKKKYTIPWMSISQQGKVE